jgi:DNA-binding transcriptional regulator YiaG
VPIVLGQIVDDRDAGQMSGDGFAARLGVSSSALLFEEKTRTRLFDLDQITQSSRLVV